MPINNNPFTYKGRIRRVSYAISVVILEIITCICVLVMRTESFDITQGFTGNGYKVVLAIATIVFIYLVVLIFFNTIKRLRDVKQSSWWSLLILLGPVYIILFIYLLIAPSKWPDEALEATPKTNSTPTTPSASPTPTTSSTSSTSTPTTPSKPS